MKTPACLYDTTRQCNCPAQQFHAYSARADVALRSCRQRPKADDWTNPNAFWWQRNLQLQADLVAYKRARDEALAITAGLDALFGWMR